ncbi:MAG: hypothetical protein A2148_07790 [Chloroflexi bacterium RBG_16_68_14]|nr:MAG: hypothetical protein A2148_07790 [Chloroflexi bacterium RBG_16_68_14]
MLSGVDEQAVNWPTRNPGWAVRDVLAHVLASDADNILLLEAASRLSTTPLHGGSQVPAISLLSDKEHGQEMARWTDATLQMFAQQLRERGDRCQALLDSLPDSAFEIPTAVHWRDGVKKLGDVLSDWRGHYPLHTEDVRLALADGPARASG